MEECAEYCIRDEGCTGFRHGIDEGTPIDCCTDDQISDGEKAGQCRGFTYTYVQSPNNGRWGLFNLTVTEGIFLF